MMAGVREEHDSMGTMEVPDWALWGASTERARRNFSIGGRGVPPAVIHALGAIKAAAALANLELGMLEEGRAKRIEAAAREVAAGLLDAHFVVDLMQTGSGTSTNTNANEVIANRANRLAGPEGEKIHPNDHVNHGQSSNDVFPTAMHLAAALAIEKKLLPALHALTDALAEFSKRWADVVKTGRTHLMDATPISMGQVFSGFAAQAEKSCERAERAKSILFELPIGGTAVGTGINTHAEFGGRVALHLAQETGLPLSEAKNHFEAQAAKDAFVELSGELKTVAVSLSKIANDLRWLGSGPRAGLGELVLPALQPGSSIMPGKVNPVISEAVIQAAVRVFANDAAVALAGFGGVGSIFELNVAMPVIIDAVLESISLLANSADALREKLLGGLEVDRERCKGYAENSLMLATRLAPAIGYDEAARLAKKAWQEGKSIREVARGVVEESLLAELLSPEKLTGPDNAPHLR